MWLFGEKMIEGFLGSNSSNQSGRKAMYDTNDNFVNVAKDLHKENTSDSDRRLLKNTPMLKLVGCRQRTYDNGS